MGKNVWSVHLISKALDISSPVKLKCVPENISMKTEFSKQADETLIRFSVRNSLIRVSTIYYTLNSLI